MILWVSMEKKCAIVIVVLQLKGIQKGYYNNNCIIVSKYKINKTKKILCT